MTASCRGWCLFMSGYVSDVNASFGGVGDHQALVEDIVKKLAGDTLIARLFAVIVAEGDSRQQRKFCGSCFTHFVCLFGPGEALSFDLFTKSMPAIFGAFENDVTSLDFVFPHQIE